MLYISISFTVVAFILGILWFNGKGVKYCNWYHALPKTNRDRIDEKAFGKCMGKLAFFLAFCFALSAASDIMSIDWLFILGWVLGIVAMIFTSLYVGSGERFRKH